MRALDALAERRILDAIGAGELDDLPGTGKPIRLDDDALVPEALRAAYRLLRNAGVVPEEVTLRRAIGELAECIERLGDDDREAARRRLALLRLRLESTQRFAGSQGRQLRIRPAVR